MLDAPRPNHTVSDATAEAGRLLGKLCEVFYPAIGDELQHRPVIPLASDHRSCWTDRIGQDRTIGR